MLKTVAWNFSEITIELGIQIFTSADGKKVTNLHPINFNNKTHPSSDFNPLHLTYPALKISFTQTVSASQITPQPRRY